MSRRTGKAETGPTDEQEKLLAEAQKQLQLEAFYMKRCLDDDKLMDALKHASNMIGELRTGLLSPQTYYALYIAAFDELRYLEASLADDRMSGKRISELYQLVQYAGNILPRLFLLVCVGSVYIKTREAPAKDVLQDLVEMCKGVQHPLRGLFLRNYLSEMTKDKLPDVGTVYEGDGGSVNDSIEFILQNFVEMNKLWVRMQHQGALKDRDRREKERQQLKLLVGKNLSRLSQLEGVTSENFKKLILPEVTQQIVSCRDKIAQQYLMEVLIQAFPDEFHLQALNEELRVLADLQPGVDLKSIVVSLLDRLSAFASRSQSDLPQDIDVFLIFFENIERIARSEDLMSLADIFALLCSLLNLSLQFYPSKIDNIGRVFTLAAEILEHAEDGSNKKPAVTKQVGRLLRIPLEKYKNVLMILKLGDAYPVVLSQLPFNLRKKVTNDIVSCAVDNSNAIAGPEQANKFLELIETLVHDVEDGEAAPEMGQDVDPLDRETWEEEQHLVGSLVHLFASSDPDQLFMMYAVARKHFGTGGPSRVKYTLVPLVYGCLSLARRLVAVADTPESREVQERKVKKVFKFVHETATALSRTEQPALSLRLFLHAALSADEFAFETIAYEFVTQAFVVYEDQLSDSKAQTAAMLEIIGVLYRTKAFSEENYQTLITKTALHSSRLLKKPDQCRAIYTCSHLFWKRAATAGDGDEGEMIYSDGKRVLECLQKSLKIADSVMDAAENVSLFVEIFNQYLYFFEQQNDVVTVQYVNGLIALINTNIGNMDAASDTGAVNSFYKNTLRHIQRKKQSSQAADERYKSIVA